MAKEAVKQLPAKEQFAQFFQGRDLSHRFDDSQEQEVITNAAASLWQERDPVSGPVDMFPPPETEFFPDGHEIYTLVPSEENHPNFGYIKASVLDPSNFLGLMARGKMLEESGVAVSLFTPYIIEQRAEKLVVGGGANHGFKDHDELPVLSAIVAGLSTAYSRGMFVIESHSLGLEYWAVENEFPVLSLSALPILIDKAKELDLINGNLKQVVLEGDLGGYMLTQMVAEELGGAEVIMGNKDNDQVFDAEEIQVIKGKQVIFPDDVISSGETVFERVLASAFEAGAKNAVVLVPHARMSDQLIEKVNQHKGKVQLIVSDTLSETRELRAQIQESPYVHLVELDDHIDKVIDLDTNGDLAEIFTDADSQEYLRSKTGFRVAPGYITRFRRPIKDATISE